jgi:hypothetical protein
MTKLHQYSLLLVLALSLWNTCSLYGQRFSVTDPRGMRNQYLELLQYESDSTILSQQLKIDSLVQELERCVHKHIAAVTHLTDSLVRAAGDSLDPARKDSAFHISSQLSETLRFHGTLHRQKLDEHFHQHQKALQALKDHHMTCAACEEADDFEEELSAFLDEADSVGSNFFEKAALLSEEGLQTLDDSTWAFQDSMMNYISTLMDNRQDELEYLEEHSTKLLLSFDSRAPYSYLGRDDGIRQAAMNPSVTFQHSSGLYVAVYNFTAPPSINGSISFSGFWSKDSTSQQQYSLSQIIDAQTSYESSLINVSADLCLNTSVGSDLGITLGCSHRWEWHSGSFEPSFSVVWGKQPWDEDLMTITTTKRQGVVRIDTSWSSTSKTSFSIMGYQIDIPVNIRIGRGVLTPILSYIIPVHVLDDSRNKSFFAFGVTFMIDWLL